MIRAAPCVLGTLVALAAQESRPVFEPGEVLRVVVFDDATGRPIEGAQVLYLHHDDRVLATTAFAAEWQRLAPDLESRLERFGRSTTTDRQGIAFVPSRGLADDIAIRTDQLYAQTWGKRLVGIEELRAGLVVNPSLDVRVVDRDGKTCPDVEIWLQRGEKFDAPGECFLVGSTGADGTCTVRRVRTFALGKSLRLVLKLPGLDVPPVLLDAEKLPRGPVTFVVPPSLPLRVRVTDAAGERTGEPATVRISAVGDAPWRSLERELRPSDRGEVVLPYVSPQLRLRVEPRAPFELPAVEVEPASAATTERLSVIALVPPGPVLVGRALDAQGRPLADRRLEGCETHGDASRGEGRRGFVVRTDGAGRFRIWLGRELCSARIGELWLHSDVPGVVARAQPFVVSGPEIALGDLTFAREPLVVAGRLPPDVRIAKRDVRVQARLGGNWSDLNLDNVVWIDECHFEFRGRVPEATELRLETRVAVVLRGTFTAECKTTPFRLGQKDVQVVH